MGARTITWTGPITPDEVKEIARSNFPSETTLFISQSAMNDLLNDPTVKNTFIWMDPKSLVDGYIILYGLRVTFYNDH